MNISRPFILRPVATTLLMAALLLSGALAYRLLPVSALPQVDYPTIRVQTLYPGASPEVLTTSATTPLAAGSTQYWAATLWDGQKPTRFRVTVRRVS